MVPLGAALHLTYDPAYAGGVRFTALAMPGNTPLLSFTWNRQDALDAAASILRAAGITHATYAGGSLAAEDGL